MAFGLSEREHGADVSGHLRHRWGLVEKLTTVVTLKVTSENFDCTWMERWLRDNVIGRIPGGRHAPE